jgi:hypothetical protein
MFPTGQAAHAVAQLAAAGAHALSRRADVAHEMKILPARNWTGRFFSARAFLYEARGPGFQEAGTAFLEM